MLSPQVHELKFLERKYAIDVLLILLDKGATPKGDVYTMLTSNSSPVEERVKELKALGLLNEVTVKKDRWRFNQLTLTERGAQIARRLQEANVLMLEDG